MNRMFSDESLQHFKKFCATAGLKNPAGAFDSRPRRMARDDGYEAKSVDQVLADAQIVQIRDILMKEGIDKRIIEAVIRGLVGSDPMKAITEPVSEQADRDAAAAREADDEDDDKDDNKVVGDDPAPFAGMPQKGGAPMQPGGTMAKDSIGRLQGHLSRFDTSRSSDASYKGMRRNMRRIGSV